MTLSMSASPPLTPPCGEIVHKIASPVGEPDIERELTPTESIRERADGGTSPPLIQSSVESDKESVKEKETKSSQDLDKDIDAMFEYNNANVSAGASISLGDISVDPALQDSSITSIVEKEEFHVGIEAHTDITDQESKTTDTDRHEESEKSFTSISTTNSSVLAEAVVNRVLSSAVKIAKDGEDMKVTETEAPTSGGDTKVGLFQYKADDTDVDSEKADGEETDKTISQTDSGDVKVGLFQYFDDAEENVQKSFIEDDTDDYDDKLESLNLSDQENILQLYGLGGPEVTETREMSTPHASPRTEEETREFFIDVQREIYEPQKRMFSVSQDKSSTESTPREKVTETVISGTREETEGELDLREDIHNITETTLDKTPTKISPAKTEEEQETNISVREDTVDSETETEKDKGTLAGPQAVPIEVAPPLVHYESVKENGKFRIIKMPKEAGGLAFGSMRVGSETSSGQSPDQSPREAKVDDTSQRPKVEAGESKDSGISQEVTTINREIEMMVEKPLDSVSQKLPVVTVPSQGAGELEKPWLSTVDKESRSADSQGISKSTKAIYKTVTSTSTKEPDLSSPAVAKSRSSGQSARLHEESRAQRSVTQPSPRQSDSDSRIKYSITDTSGRENKRTGPVPYSMEDYRYFS